MSRFLPFIYILLLVGLLPGEDVRAQRIEGFALNYDQLPSQLKEPIPLGKEDFNVRLATGGKWEITGDVILAPADPTMNKKFLLALDTLDLSHGGRIVTNGHTLVLVVNTLKAGDGKIVAFLEKETTSGENATSAGADGGRGAQGDDGGIVSIHVVQQVEGLLDVDLSGQNGGTGGAGARGPKGAKGSDGRRGVSGTVDCKRGGENGKDGHKGETGGRGGDGGNAGDGGTLFVYTLGEPLTSAQYKFSASPGSPGAGGKGGPGGPGGNGGKRGGGDGHCKGGKKDGSSGPPGAPGASGDPGDPGAEGLLIVEGLELEVLISKAAGG